MLKYNPTSSRTQSFVALCGAFMAIMSVQSSFGATLNLNFTSPVPGTIQDSSSQGTGFTTPLSGTNTASPNSGLLLASGTLQVTGPSAGADFNSQANIGTMQAPGILLSSLGFTGSQDFSVSTTFSVPAGAFSNFGQIGVYVGSNSASVTRDGFVFVNVGGPLTGAQFYGTNNTGLDAGTTFSAQPGLTSSDILTATISRTGGVFDETVKVGVLTFDITPTDSTLFTSLNSLTNLTVGIYSTNTPSETAFTTPFDSFSATVDVSEVPEPGTWAMMLGGVAFLFAVQRLRLRKD
jgi:arabinan endo-1,5-alpha-L-arabinosidase